MWNFVGYNLFYFIPFLLLFLVSNLLHIFQFILSYNFRFRYYISTLMQDSDILILPIPKDFEL